MVVKYFTIFAINILLFSLALTPHTALADTNQDAATTISPYNLSYHAADSYAPFTLTPAPAPQKARYIILTHNNAPQPKSSFTKNEQSVEERILSKIPYGKRFKHMWNIVDGDVDLYFEGLRADRGNKGVAYKTRTVPFIGEVEGLQFKFEAGEEQKFSFETNKVPIIGAIEGFNLRGSAGNNNKISARYTYQFD